MPISLYMDQNVPRSITVGLRLRGIDVITAYEDDASLMSDPELLNRANELKRVLFSYDDNFLVEAAERQKRDFRFGVSFTLTNSVFQSKNVLTVLRLLLKPESRKIYSIMYNFCLFEKLNQGSMVMTDVRNPSNPVNLGSRQGFESGLKDIIHYSIRHNL